MERVVAAGRTRSSASLTVRASVMSRSRRPDVVVNCAGFTGVDAAESECATALAVNGHGARRLARACAAVGSRMVQVSTDYVFPGTERSEPYSEGEPTQAHSSYGHSKLAGESAVAEELGPSAVIARTAWLYGHHGGGFVRTLIDRARDRRPVSAIADQHGQPTWTGDLAARLIELGRRPGISGVLHCTNGGQTTWYGLARGIYERLGADTGLVSAISAAQLDRPAPRPAYSVLGHRRWAEVGIEPIVDWRDRLRAAFPTLPAPTA